MAQLKSISGIKQTT